MHPTRRPALRPPVGRVLAAAALAALLAGCGASTATGAEVPEPPDGMRWVGAGRVVVAVPDWWTTGETWCGAPVEDTVYADNAATYDCADPADPATVREVSALAVLDATSGYGELMTRDMRSVASPSDARVVELAGCEEWFQGVCRHLFAVPDEGVLFAVTIADPGDADYETIRDSLRTLPEGWTTVPLTSTDGWTPGWGAEPAATDALEAALERAGLVVRRHVVVPPDDPAGDPAGDYVRLPAGSYLGSTPELGSVIEEGGTVTLAVAGEPSPRH